MHNVLRVVRKRILALAALVLVVIFCTAWIVRSNPKDDFLDKHAVIVLRNVGHKLLLHAGDSSSRIMPVKVLSPGSFQLEFENEFSFKPDSLVTIVQAELASGNLPLNYIVNLVDCSSWELIYGFEIGIGKNSVMPCMGRTQPKGCYLIQVTFFDFEKTKGSDFPYYAAVFGVLGLVLLIFVSKSLSSKSSPEAPKSSTTTELLKSVGLYNFNEKESRLEFESELIPLSNKECKVLTLLIQQPNELVERAILLKKVWEDEGVITSRSLDMYISKLRKKLSRDSKVSLVNVSGKGYRLVVEPLIN
jgi:hypothetical protein